MASTPFSIEAFWNFRKIAKNYDIIHFHYPYPFADFLFLFSFLKKPALVTYHSDIIKQKILKFLYLPLQKMFLQRMKRIVATSPQYASTSKTLQKYERKTTVIPLGLSDFAKLSKRPDLAKKYANIFERPFILFVGGFRSYKGLENLIQASANIKATVVIAGDGKLAPTLHQLVRSLGLTNVTFTGAIDDHEKFWLIDQCTCLILPSNQRTEAFGIVQIEALMRSKPIISTDIGTGTNFVNEHLSTGLVIDPDDNDALVTAANFMISQRNVAKEMGIQSRKRFLKHFTAKKMNEGYVKIYNDLFDENL